MTAIPKDDHLPESTLNTLLEGFQLISFEWKYLYVNDSVVNQSRYTREQLIGRTMMEMYPGIEKTAMFRLLKKSMKKRTPGQIENEFTFPDGTKQWFELRIHPAREGLSILSIDISERKKAELNRMEYIRDLEEMIFMTTHKVRQPVSRILGISNVLDIRNNSEHELRKIAGYMKESAENLDYFTRDMMELIRGMKFRAESGTGRH